MKIRNFYGKTIDFFREHNTRYGCIAAVEKMLLAGIDEELLEKDNEYFGIKAPVRDSGDLKGSENITIIGPKGIVFAKESTIVANRHIHMSAEDLKTFDKQPHDIVRIKCENGVVMDNVHIKSDETCVLEYHMNKDEAEDLGIETGMEI